MEVHKALKVKMQIYQNEMNSKKFTHDEKELTLEQQAEMVTDHIKFHGMDLESYLLIPKMNPSCVTSSRKILNLHPHGLSTTFTPKVQRQHQEMAIMQQITWTFHSRPSCQSLTNHEAKYLTATAKGPQIWTHFLDLCCLSITENDAQHTIKASCCCFENGPNTDLLLFTQSM